MSIRLNGKFTEAEIMIDNVESGVIAQIYGVINHPVFGGKKIRIMPDTHAGKGCVIGFTAEIDMKDPRIIPNLIGVDIGCGVISVCLGAELGRTLEDINARIIRTIPMGFDVNDRAKVKDNMAYARLCKKVGAGYNRVLMSAGSLGSGNHFIEIGMDCHHNYWLTVHTGSRNLGKCVCDYHQRKAVEYITRKSSVPIEEFKKLYSGTVLGEKIAEFNAGKEKIDKDLCYIEGADAWEYLEDMKLTQEYAALNRQTIVSEILDVCGLTMYSPVESVHNYIDFSDGILRKGAIRAYKGERCVIPLNMRDGFLLCKGKSNPDWNCSAPHGAGRIMSRAGAKQSISVEDYRAAMEGIYSTCVNAQTVDESPMAYKDSALIESAIGDTCEVFERIKPVLNIKAGG